MHRRRQSVDLTQPDSESCPAVFADDGLPFLGNETMTKEVETTPVLTEKRQQWLAVLNGEDQHSIHRQLIRMTWDATVFHVVNEARGMADPSPDGGVQLNGMVHRLFDQGFFISQCVAIRRLVDGYDLDGDRGVYSLIALLEDMERHGHLLTRRNIYDAEELEYDDKAIEQQFSEGLYHHYKTGEYPDDMPPNGLYLQSTTRHKHIDQLSGVAESDRSPDDQILPSVFQNLKTRVNEVCDDVARHVNKFIAHASTPESREKVEASGSPITLQHLEDAREALCQITAFLAVYMLGDSSSDFFPIPQYEQFEYIERPLVKAADIIKLERVWNARQSSASERHRWTIEDYHQYVRTNCE